MLKNYLKIAFRHIIKHKVFSLINIAGLSVGIACCIFIFLWIQNELSYDRFHENKNDLYRIIIHSPMGTIIASPYAMVPLLKESYPEIVKATRYYGIDYAVKYEDKTFYETGGLVDGDFFEMFTFPLVKGNPRDALPDKNSVVISERLAVKYFGNEDPIGKILTMDNQVKLAVTGVLKNVPANSHLQFDFLASMQLLPQELLASWAKESIGYVWLAPNASVDGLRKKIADTIVNNDKRNKIKTVVDLQPLKDIKLYSFTGTDPIVYIYIFAAIALIILLIACINYINLSTAKSSYRAKEIGIRKVLGAGRGNIIKQFFGESILITFFAMILAIILVMILLPVFNSMTLKQLSLNFFHNITALLFLIFITALTGVLANSYTALYMASFQPINIIKTSFTPGSRNYNLRRVLVVIQFALTVILIICTAVVYKQQDYIRNKDLGFDKENILSISMNEELKKNYDVAKQELLQNPGVLHVTSAVSPPLNITNFNFVYWQGKSPEESVHFNWDRVNLDYFETFNMKMAQGRTFFEEFSPNNLKYIINETALKYMDLKEPLGKLFSIQSFKGEIVGVVKDFNNSSLHSEINKVAFILTPGADHDYMYVKMGAGNIPQTLSYVKNVLLKLAPSFPLQYRFIDEMFDAQYKSEQQSGLIFKYFAILAIFISCLGLYGLVSSAAEQKTKEIGIRKVYGASEQSIIYMMSKEFVKLDILSAIIAMPIAYYVMHRWLQNYAYHTTLNIWIFLGSAALSILITILTVWYQAFKAARANPVRSLKYE